MLCHSEPPQLSVINKQDKLKELQEDVAALAKYVEKLSQWKNQEVRLALKSKIVAGTQQLAFLADSINLLADQLEVEILKFKEIAIETNKAFHAIQQPPDLKEGMEAPTKWRPLNIWQVNYSGVPVVVQQSGTFLLTARTVDLFESNT